MNTKLRTILIAGLIAGALDITAAFVVYSGIMKVVSPKAILVSITGGISPATAATGGNAAAAVGLALHFLIAIIFAAIFVMLYPAVRKIISNKWLLGIVYGCIVWLAMNCVVVPFSSIGRWPKWNFEFTRLPLAVLILIVCVGIPISLITTKMYRNDSL